MRQQDPRARNRDTTLAPSPLSVSGPPLSLAGFGFSLLGAAAYAPGTTSATTAAITNHLFMPS
jgi:hypothetical protein